MKSELIQKVLESESGVKKNGSVYEIGDDVELNIVLAIGSDATTVPRVRRVTVGPDLLTLETHKGERVYLAADAGVRALKFSPADGPNKLRGAGFTALR